MTDLRNGMGDKKLIAKTNRLILGFGHFYKIAECLGTFEGLDRFVRSRVRRKLQHTKSHQTNRINNLLLNNAYLGEL
jgi:hypothetical protein